MTYRAFPLFLLAVALMVCVAAPVAAYDADKNSHDGTFVKATSDNGFVMEDKGKEHKHTLSADAKVIGPDGKACKLADFKKGQKIRVTTKEGDKKVATRVEALKD
jgi:DNA/RNA-binding domain of Phe-tRNA-synthetase-like protein